MNKLYSSSNPSISEFLRVGVLCSLLGLLIVSPALAQQTIFSEMIPELFPGGPGFTGNAGIATFDNGYMIAGEANQDGFILKLDSAGNMLWHKTVTGSGLDNLLSLAATSDSCYVFLGKTDSPGYTHGSQDILVFKLNNAGDTVWTEAIGSLDFDQAYVIRETNDHGFVIGGYMQPSSGQGSANYLVKLDSAGHQEWNLSFAAASNPNGEFISSLCQAADSSFFVAGQTMNYPPGYGDAYVAHISSSGNLLWTKKFNRNPRTTFFGNDLVILDSALYCYFSAGADMAILKMDFSGNTIWSKEWNGITGANCWGCGEPVMNSTQDKSLVLICSGGWASAITKIDTTGTLQWIEDLMMFVKDVRETPDSGFFVTGYGPLFGVAPAGGFGGSQIGIIKTDALGNPANCGYTDQAPVMQSYSLADSTIHPVSTTTGRVDRIPLNFGTSTPVMRLGCVDIEGGITENSNTNILQLSPVPAHEKIKVSCKNMPVQSIDIYDIYGKAVLHSDLLSTATETEQDISKLSPGVYLLRVNSGSGSSLAKRFVKVGSR